MILIVLFSLLNKGLEWATRATLFLGSPYINQTKKDTNGDILIDITTIKELYREHMNDD